MSSGVSEPSYFGVMFIWLDFFYVLFKVTTSPVFCLFKLKHLRRVFYCLGGITLTCFLVQVTTGHNQRRAMPGGAKEKKPSQPSMNTAVVSHIHSVLVLDNFVACAEKWPFLL